MPTSRRRRRAATRGPWIVYLVRTRTGMLYTGITLDVAARIVVHAAGAGAKALRGRGPLQLAFAAAVGRRGAALRVEARIKRLHKADKERLVSDPGFAARVVRARRGGASRGRRQACAVRTTLRQPSVFLSNIS